MSTTIQLSEPPPSRETLIWNDLGHIFLLNLKFICLWNINFNKNNFLLGLGHQQGICNFFLFTPELALDS